MPKRNQKPKEEPVSQEQERAQVEDELFSLLMQQARAGGAGAARAIDLIGRLRRFDLFCRPEAGKAPDGISEATARKLIDIYERIEHKSYESPHPDNCPCPRCTEIKFDRTLKDQPLQPKPEPVDVAACTTLKEVQ
jgi:hypothetical protein